MAKNKSSVGLFTITNSNAGHSWHYHNEYNIIFAKKSRGVLYSGDRIIPYSEGDIFLIGKNIPHSFYNELNRNDKNDCIEIIIVFFKYDFLGKEFFNTPEMKIIDDLLKNTDSGLTVISKEKQASAKIINEMRHAQDFTKIQLLLNLLHMLAESNSCSTIIKDKIAPKLNRYQEKRIKAILDYTQQNFSGNISLSEIAKNSFMTPPAFSSFFKKKLGTSFINYVNNLRIQKACRRLIHSDDSITTIAFGCGFNNLSNFNRRFKQYQKVTPREFRLLHREINMHE